MVPGMGYYSTRERDKVLSCEDRDEFQKHPIVKDDRHHLYKVLEKANCRGRKEICGGQGLEVGVENWHTVA